MEIQSCYETVLRNCIMRKRISKKGTRTPKAMPLNKSEL